LEGYKFSEVFFWFYCTKETGYNTATQEERLFYTMLSFLSVKMSQIVFY